MDRKRKVINCIAGIFCALFLIGAWIIYLDIDDKFAGQKDEIVTVGVFSDSYWEVQNGYSYRILEDAIEIFEENHPGVKINYVSGIMKDDYSEWLAEQSMAGQLPDVFFVLEEDFYNMSETGILKDLTAIIEEDQTFQKEDFFSSTFSSGRYKDTQYAVPYECAPKLMFVNKTILDREKIAMPRQDWTWEEFYEICNRVTKDTDGNGTLDQFGEVGYTWKDAFESNGVQIFKQGGTECNLTGDGVEEALQLIEKLEELNGRYTTSEKDFDLGNVVFQPMSFSKFRAYKSYPLSVKKYSGFEWECIPMPAGPEGDNISSLDTLQIGMNCHTKKLQYAWEFIKTLTYNKQIQSEIFDYSEGVSVLKQVTEADQTLARLVEGSEDHESLNLLLLSDAVEHAVVAPGFHNQKEAEREVEQAVNEIIGSSSSMRMEQIIWNRKINKYLKE